MADNRKKMGERLIKKLNNHHDHGLPKGLPKNILPTATKSVSVKTVSVKKSKGNAIMVDTNVLIHDPVAIDILREGNNILLVPLKVLMELDALKNRPGVGIDAREAIKRLEKEIFDNTSNIKIVRTELWSDLDGLSRDQPDHQILAAVNHIIKTEDGNFAKMKFLSRDKMARILAKEYLAVKGLIVEDYYYDQVSEIRKNIGGLPRINVPVKIIKNNADRGRGRGINEYFFYPEELNKRDLETVAGIKPNGGVVCYSHWNGDLWSAPSKNQDGFFESFAAILKSDRLIIIDKTIDAFGIAAYSPNGNGPNWPNWAQMLALYQLLDDSIKLVFLQGGAGTGKTLLSVAAALEQRRKFDRIIVTRPLIHLEGEDKMGFLPGNINKKMEPWLKPIFQALAEIKETKDKHSVRDLAKHLSGNDKSEDGSKDVIPESLDYIRGQSLRKTFLIVDEAQNLTPYQV